MSIKNKISINAHYTRSVNLERDANSLDVVNAYIPTSRALRTFSRLADTFHNQQAPRAWSLVGPYGSGKSSFSVFLSHLLSDPEAETSKAACKILNKVDKKLTKLFSSATKNSEGYLKILITGAPEPMGKRLIKGMYVSSLEYWNSRPGKNHAIVTRLEKATNDREISVSKVLDLVKDLQIALGKTQCAGIVLVIDELGKFLEYEARHYGANDIYLLQSLAEHACGGNAVNLFLFVLLHQSFEQYAKGLGENLKNEWSKVQGRFEEVPFLESAEQVLRVVSAAFKQDLTIQEKNSLRKAITAHTKVLFENEALPGVMKEDEATDLFVSCYPLHPVSAILLPLLCQKVAQNERTLFSYLGSHEEFGLQDMLEKINKVGGYINPHHIYDYFISNQPAVMGDYATHRRWAEVVTAIERLGDVNDDAVDLLKTIGIMNIVGGKGGFKASKVILAQTAPTKTVFNNEIKTLGKKSVVNFRRFNSEYRIWQGSDFDLEEALQEEKNNLGVFSVANELNNSKNMLPIVARKYTIQNGTLRYFIPTFVDAKTFSDTEAKSKEARIIFYLAAAQDDEKIFNEKVITHFSPLDIVVLCLNGSQLREAVAETLALKRVQINCQELNTDQIARREFQDRLTAAEFSEDSMLDDLLDSPEENLWFNDAKKLKVLSKRSLQQALSSVLEKVFNLTPIINNELINRDKLSAQGNGARNKLLLAMLNNEDKAELDIEKFPAEKAIYRSLLRETGLHRGKGNSNNDWKFTEPELDGRKDKYNIRHVWTCIDEFLESTEKNPRAIIELNEQLMSPPYGMKAGVLPVLYIASYLCYQHEIAIYDNRSYKPYFTEEMLERFIKRPNEFTFQRFRIKGLRASIFEQYSKVINNGNKPRTLLELVKPLARYMGDLPEYTQKTRRLTNNAINVRTAFNLAKSPENLLFSELPEALGFKDLVIEADEKNLEDFSQALTKSLKELGDAYEELLEKQKELLAQAFSLTVGVKNNLSELRKALTHSCFGLENYTIDTKGVRAFIIRINKSTGSDQDWLENLLMFLGHKPSKKWLDNDQDAAEYRLMMFSRNVIDLKRLELYEMDIATKMDGDFDVYLLSSVKKGLGISDKVVPVDNKSKKRITEIKKEITKNLSELSDHNLAWAALAEVVDEYLRKDLSSNIDGNSIIENSKPKENKRK